MLLSPDQRLTLTCIPEPLSLSLLIGLFSSKIGFGIKFATFPYFLARLRTTSLYICTLSAASVIVLCIKLISICPLLATSWLRLVTLIEKLFFRILATSNRNSNKESWNGGAS